MKKWRDAASIIIAAAKSPALTNASVFSACDYKELPKEKTDFQILALKKSSESPTLSGHYVFPGGTTSSADSSDEWIPLFTKFGYCLDTLCKSLNNYNTRLPIFDNNYNRLPNSISLRITAIRETFEECGILLCKRAPSKINNISPVKTEHLNIKDITVWREKVSKNPEEFLNLCLNNDCYPDVASLYLWSNWMTPTHVPIRFDSVIFMTFLENIIEAVPDYYEISSSKWTLVADVLQGYYSNIYDLHFPQLYELSRLARLSSFEKLIQLACDINGSESEVIMPVYLFAKDGVMLILPGDEMYPEKPDYITPYAIIKEDALLESFNCKQMNRFVVPSTASSRARMIVNNYAAKSCKYVSPWYPDVVANLRGHL